MDTDIAIFLDDGGVMSDNSVRGEQWPPLVGEYLAPRLGDTPERWAEANRYASASLFAPEALAQRNSLYESFAEFDRRYQIEWLTLMLGFLGLPMLPDEEAFYLARDTTSYIAPKIKADFPEVARCVRTLHESGFDLYTASGEASYEIHDYMESIEIADCFHMLYGPDLVDTPKSSPSYYARIFAHADVEPSSAVVVDDRAESLQWAQAAGAQGVLVCRDAQEHHPSVDGFPVIRSLAELEEVIAVLAG